MEFKNDFPTVQDLKTCIQNPAHILNPPFEQVCDSSCLNLLTPNDKQALAHSLTQWANQYISKHTNNKKNTFHIPYGLRVAKIFINHVKYYTNMKQNIYGIVDLVAMYSPKYNKKIYLFGEYHKQYLNPQYGITPWIDKYTKTSDKIIDVYIELWNYMDIPLEQSGTDDIDTYVPEYYNCNLFVMNRRFKKCFSTRFNPDCPPNMQIYESDIRQIIPGNPYSNYMSNLIEANKYIDIYNLLLKGYKYLFPTIDDYEQHIVDIFDRAHTFIYIEHTIVPKEKIISIIDEIYISIRSLYEPVNLFEQLKTTTPDDEKILFMRNIMVADIYNKIADIFCILQFLSVYNSGYTSRYAFSIWGATHTKNQAAILTKLGFETMYKTTFTNRISADAGIMVPFAEEEPFEWISSSLPRLYNLKSWTLTSRDIFSIIENPSLLLDARFKHVYSIPNVMQHDPFKSQALTRNLYEYIKNKPNDDLYDENPRIINGFQYNYAVAQMLMNHFKPKILTSMVWTGSFRYLTSTHYNKYVYLISLDDITTTDVAGWFNEYFQTADKLIDVFAHLWIHSHPSTVSPALYDFYSVFSSCFQSKCMYDHVRMHYTDVLYYLFSRQKLDESNDIIGNDTIQSMKIYKFMSHIYLFYKSKQTEKQKQRFIKFIKKNESYYFEPTNVAIDNLLQDLLYLFTRNKTLKQVIDMPEITSLLRNNIAYINQTLKYSASDLIRWVQDDNYEFVQYYYYIFALCNVIYTISRMLRYFSDGTTTKYIFILTSMYHLDIIHDMLAKAYKFTSYDIDRLDTQDVFPEFVKEK